MGSLNPFVFDGQARVHGGQTAEDIGFFFKFWGIAINYESAIDEKISQPYLYLKTTIKHIQMVDSK